MSDLNDLFGAVDAEELMADLKEYGVMAASAVAANVGFNMASRFVLSKWTTAPSWAAKYAMPGAAILLGALGGGYVSRYNRQVGLGVGVGLVSAGLSQLAKGFFPSLPLQGLGDEALLDAGNPYGRYLSDVTIEQGAPMAGLGGATLTFETGGSPAMPPPRAVAGFGGVGNFAAVLQ